MVREAGAAKYQHSCQPLVLFFVSLILVFLIQQPLPIPPWPGIVFK